MEWEVIYNNPRPTYLNSMHNLFFLLCATNHFPFQLLNSYPHYFSAVQAWNLCSLLSVPFTMPSPGILMLCLAKCLLDSSFPLPSHFTPVMVFLPSFTFSFLWLIFNHCQLRFSKTSVLPNQSLQNSGSLIWITTDCSFKAKLLWQIFKATHNLPLFLSQPSTFISPLFKSVVLNQWQFCPPRGHLAISGSVFSLSWWDGKKLVPLSSGYTS